MDILQGSNITAFYETTSKTLSNDAKKALLELIQEDLSFKGVYKTKNISIDKSTFLKDDAMLEGRSFQEIQNLPKGEIDRFRTKYGFLLKHNKFTQKVLIVPSIIKVKLTDLNELEMRPRYKHDRLQLVRKNARPGAKQFHEEDIESPPFFIIIDDKQGNGALFDLANSTFVSNGVFSEVKDFHNGLAAACVGDKRGFIDLQAQRVIQPKFDGCRNFVKTNRCLVYCRVEGPTRQGEWKYINREGEIIDE